ncbi:MAG: hypothetical protein QOJ95_4210, partial [Mycobacterium sp.]|nr:hypothetical protein [Mycobacterium sp.]
MTAGPSTGRSVDAPIVDTAYGRVRG